MKHAVVVSWAVTIVLAWLVIPGAQERARPSPAAQQEFTVAPGFVVERVAGPPLVDRPIVADFDEQGRLYVADSSGSSDKVEQQLAERPHRIVRLEDTDGDGRFDASIVFADRMMFPEGAMWFDGSLYVAAPPSIWRLTDTDGDGVADRREEWFQGKTLTGCANDLHGPYLGPDGWIYWTKGAFAQQTYERPGKAPLVTRASHILRRRPGSDTVEIVMTGGMDNPVDVAFTPEGERIFTATFLEHPQLGRRDALVHAVYGGVYGKPHGVVDGHVRTGELMPVMTQLGPAVPAGFTRYASQAFGDEYRDAFFAAMFNLRKVTRHTLEPRGGTYVTRDADFLVSSNRDFHPTDVIEDADGSLLVVDTGPWYKLCCPTSQLAKPDVPGAIYRVRREGARPVADPRGLRLAWGTMSAGDLAGLLDDPRPAVRRRAQHDLGRAGDEASGVLQSVLKASGSRDRRREALWALARIDGPKARQAVRTALDDRDASVRHAAVHVVALWRDREAVPALLGLLKRDGPAIRRAAAEALGRIGDPGAVADLVAAAAAVSEGPGSSHARETESSLIGGAGSSVTGEAGSSDPADPAARVLEHSLTYALIEIGDPAAIAVAARQAASPRSRRAALIALDQMEGGGVTADAILPLLDSADPTLNDTAWWIAGRHPEWGGALAGYFRPRLSAPGLDGPGRDVLLERLVQFGQAPAIQELLAVEVRDGSRTAARVMSLRAMAAVARTRLKVVPPAWAPPLARALDSSEIEVVRHAVAVIRAVPPGKTRDAALDDALVAVARDARRPGDVRLEALAAAVAGLKALEPGLFELARGGLASTEPLAVRTAAAAVVQEASLDSAQLLALAGALATVGPLELPRVLRAFDRASDEAVGLAMVAGLTQSEGRSGLRPDLLRPRLGNYPASVQKAGEALLETLNVDADSQLRRLEELLPAVQQGDARRGQAVFNSPQAACASCHAIGYLGGKIGPDLTRIGQVRGERDLLEAVIFPNASFARGYEPVAIRTASGGTYNGVLRSESPDEVVLAAADGTETRIARAEIADMDAGTVSLMPPGFDERLTSQELADLVAFLKASR